MMRSSRGLPPPINAGLLSLLPGHDHMPMVLHCIISPTREQPRNHGPFVTIQSMSRQKPVFFFLTKCPPVDSWI